MGRFWQAFFEAGQKFFFGKLFAAAVAFEHEQAGALDFLISGEAVTAA